MQKERKKERKKENDSGLNTTCQYKVRNHPATIGRSLNGMFLGIDEMYLKDIDKKIANAVCARYYKGLEADNSNAVLVEFYE